MCHHAQLFTSVLRLELGSSCLASKPLTAEPGLQRLSFFLLAASSAASSLGTQSCQLALACHISALHTLFHSLLGAGGDLAGRTISILQGS